MVLSDLSVRRPVFASVLSLLMLAFGAVASYTSVRRLLGKLGLP